MSEGKIILNRAELYEQVWSLPITRLAAKYGLSDNGLRKICRKLNIPTPPIGYWARLQHGKKVVKKPLPQLKYGEPDIYTTGIKRVAEQLLENDSQIKDLITEEEREGKITVQERLASPHPLVAKTLEVLSEVKPDEYGVLRPWRQKYLDLRVSPASLKRALRIMDAIVKAFEKRTFKVEIITDKVPVSYVMIHDHRLYFSLWEKIDRVEHIPTKQEIEEQKKYSWNRPPLWDYKATGRLSLYIKEYSAEGLRKSWSDGKSKRLEDMLNDFIAGAIKVALVSREEHLQREKIWEEERRKEAEERKRQIAEETFIKDLEMNAARWAKSRQIQAFIEKVEENFAQKANPPEIQAAFEKWVKKAKQYASRMDPLSKGFLSE